MVEIAATVTSLAEAEKWFLTHSEGVIECTKQVGEETVSHICGSYPEAKAFYAE